jgi:predicted O-methyltransferase YrrM
VSLLKRELLRRPRLANPLHAMGLFEVYTQTTPEELACLERHARGRAAALEIGTYMGASACRIARVLAPQARLYCVDPWERRNGKEDPCLSITRRELRRMGIAGRVQLLRGRSGDVEGSLPSAFDFIFVDGDHSYEGVAIDWAIVLRRLSAGGVVCMHDTSVPETESWRTFGSVRYYDEVVSRHEGFRHLERCYSMNVLERLA